MARTKAISITTNGTEKIELAEVSGYVIENVQKQTLATALKSQVYTGNPATGSVEFKRFKNSQSNVYGSARSSGKGTALEIPPITVNLDQHREIVEEASKFDIDTIGVGNIMARRADNHIATMTAELDEAFFNAAQEEGTEFSTTETDAGVITESLIQTLETVKNDYVRGVPRNMIRLILSPEFYGDMRNYLDRNVSNVNVDTAAEEFMTFHGVRVYSSVFLPSGVHAIAMIDGAIAQPVVMYPYNDPEKIPLSNDYGISLFFDYGTKVLTPDLVFVFSENSTIGG